MAVEELHGCEVFQILVITKYMNSIEDRLQFSSAFLKSTNDGHWFLIVDFIVIFCQEYFFEKYRTG
jgi:hypothetical protein